jgi:hypothetical protein
VPIVAGVFCSPVTLLACAMMHVWPDDDVVLPGGQMHVDPFHVPPLATQTASLGSTVGISPAEYWCLLPLA